MNRKEQNIAVFEDTMDSVSYTHLDVYKRQLMHLLSIAIKAPKCAFYQQ